MKRDHCYNSCGFAVLSLTLMLLLITFSISVPSAFAEYKRIQRLNLALLHQQTKIKASMNLDLFYLALYESPTMLQLAKSCSTPALEQQITFSETAREKYQLFEAVYLCQQDISSFAITVRMGHNAGVENVVASRQLQYFDGQLSWVIDSFIDFE